MDNNQDPKYQVHFYDGIEEHDNALPNWWLVTFFATIIFGFNYFIHYTFGGGETQYQELAAEMAALPKATEQDWNEGELTTKMAAFGNSDGGHAVYTAKCAACHGPDGGGLIGPNLADSYWLHGKGTRRDLMKIITAGVTEKGMPSWKGMITDEEIVQVASFVYSLKGKSVQNPKAPQGEEVKP